MERVFSQNKDADRIILNKLTILVNQYAYSLTDENFWMNRLLSRYPQVKNIRK
jgi:hypothetical protein